MPITEQEFNTLMQNAIEKHEQFASASLCRLLIESSPQLIRIMREANGFTQQQLGQVVGMSQPAVSAIESGRYVPSPMECMKIIQTCVYGAADQRLGPLRELRRLVGPPSTTLRTLEVYPMMLDTYGIQQLQEEYRAKHGLPSLPHPGVT